MLLQVVSGVEPWLSVSLLQECKCYLDCVILDSGWNTEVGFMSTKDLCLRWFCAQDARNDILVWY